jgi:hypothetical protein
MHSQNIDLSAPRRMAVPASMTNWRGPSGLLRRSPFLIAIALTAAAQTPRDYSVREVLSKSGAVQTQAIRLPALDSGKTYSILFSIDSAASA